MDFSRRCPRFHHANSRPTLSRLQRARRKNLYSSLEYTTFCLKKQVKKTISMKVQNFVTFPVHSQFKFGADVPLFPNGDIAHHAVSFRALPFLRSSMLTATAEIAMLTMTHLKASASLSVRHIW